MTNQRQKVGYLFIAPALLIIAAVSLYPIFYEVYLSLTDWYLLKRRNPVWDGLNGYRRLWDDHVFWASLVRTLYWAGGTVALEYLIAMPLALLLNRRSRLNGVMTGVILLPWVMPTIVVAYTWRWLLDAQYGTVHNLLHRVGLVSNRSVLTDPHKVLPALIFISAWKGAPFMTIALLATMKSIPGELYEAAALDGASLWRQFRDVSLPLLRTVSVVMSLVLAIFAFYSFDIVWVITKGGPGDATLLVGVYLFRAFFERLEFSYAATMGIAMLVMLIGFAAVYLRVLQRTAD